VLNLYALALEKAGSVEDDKVRAALDGLELDAPQGRIRLDGSNNTIACSIPMSLRRRRMASITASSNISARSRR
jgi:Periplasmic binding protein domain